MTDYKKNNLKLAQNNNLLVVSICQLINEKPLSEAYNAIKNLSEAKQSAFLIFKNGLLFCSLFVPWQD